MIVLVTVQQVVTNLLKMSMLQLFRQKAKVKRIRNKRVRNTKKKSEISAKASDKVKTP